MLVLVAFCFLQGTLASIPPPSARIVGGKPANKSQFPYQVSIRDSRNINNFNHLCTGVLIGYSEVLTAAHRVRNVPLQNLYIVSGTTSLSLAKPGYVIANASYSRVHEFFKPNDYSYNIAFIRLSKKLPENRMDIRPIALLNELPDEGANCTVSGWGDMDGTTYFPTISEELLFAHVPYVSQTECKKSYLYLPADGVCSAKSGTTTVPCGKLDSGDPLYCAGGLLGLFSWNDGCGPRNIPSVYTSIPFHLYWISQRMNEVTTVTPPTTTKPTTMNPTTTTKQTTKPTAKPTIKPTAKPTDKPTTKPPVNLTTKAPTQNPTMETTLKPNGSRFNSIDLFVVFLPPLLAILLT